jgi:hypothetical protein
MVGEAQIVVRAQEEHRSAVEHHAAPLGAVDHADAATESGGLQLGQSLPYIDGSLLG